MSVELVFRFGDSLFEGHGLNPPGGRSCRAGFSKLQTNGPNGTWGDDYSIGVFYPDLSDFAVAGSRGDPRRSNSAA
ncbi:hypothetical protein B7486_06805 [cyanobacterium TDX16]|nr:hypothetical protein B7486_06805 [cyanobacterium TDX16]